MLNKEQAEKIWRLIKDTKIAMLTSVDGEVLRARPMRNVQKAFDGTLWFFTESDAAKVEETKKDHHVCVSYADPDEGNYVSLSGRARLTQDINLIDQFWNSFVAAWFPQGKHDKKVALLEVRIEQAEYWDAESNKMVQLYEFLKSNLKGEKLDLGENQKYD